MCYIWHFAFLLWQSISSSVIVVALLMPHSCITSPHYSKSPNSLICADCRCAEKNLLTDLGNVPNECHLYMSGKLPCHVVSLCLHEVLIRSFSWNRNRSYKYYDVQKNSSKVYEVRFCATVSRSVFQSSMLYGAQLWWEASQHFEMSIHSHRA